MARRDPREFSGEYKAEAVALVRSSGKTIREVSRHLDLTETAVRDWGAPDRRGLRGASPYSQTAPEEVEAPGIEPAVLSVTQGCQVSPRTQKPPLGGPLVVECR